MPSDTYTLVVSDVGFATPIDGSVTTAKIVDANVTLAKLQNIATDNLIGRSTAGTGVPELIPCTSFARTLLDDSNAATAQATLGLGNLATQNSSSVTVTGGTISGVTITGGSVATGSLTGTVAVANGGTNLASYTAGDMLYASGTTTLSKLAAGASNTTLLSGTTPSWGKLPLTTHVSGVLPVANGGTNAIIHQKGACYDQNFGSPVAQTVVTSVYEPLDASPTLSVSNGMSLGSSGTLSLVNTDASTRTFLVYANVNADAGNNDHELGLKLYSGLSGSVSAIDATEVRWTTGHTGTSPIPVDLIVTWIVTLQQYHEVVVYIANFDGTSININNSKLVATAIL